VLTYIILCGSFPFKGSTDKELYKRITLGQPYLPERVSSASKSLISRMLSVDVDKRPTAREIAADPWLTINQYTDNSPIKTIKRLLKLTIRAYHGTLYERQISFSNTMINPFSTKNKWSFAAKLSNPIIEEKSSFDRELVASILKLGHSIEEVQGELRNKGSYIRNLYGRLKNGVQEPKDALGGIMKFNATAPFPRFIKPSPSITQPILQI
jgi:serine/threonine protein kinase